MEFGKFVRRIFSARRKTLRNALSLAGMDAGTLLDRLGINPQSRAEDLTPEDYVRLFENRVVN
jgi:16S rRNA A1518/A1519 N6-dimethyltransferase RsmA/KsgA/DIM1 with predicted DNA glycosylase/AP lyase activity